jgi:hypothetical protein
MRSGKAFLAAAAMALGLLTGCVSYQVDDHSYQFNEATGSLGMRLLLLNAVRASKDYPLQFSKISLYQGQGTTGASVSASLPLRLPIDGTLSPKVDWKDGISRVDLVDLNTEEAQEALKRPLTHSGFAYHKSYHGNRSSILPQFLLVEHITLSTKLADVINESVQCTCAVVNHKACSRSIAESNLSNVLDEFRTKSHAKSKTLKGKELAEFKQKAAQEYSQLRDSISRLKESRSKFVENLKAGKKSVAEEVKYACQSLEKLYGECPETYFPRTMDNKSLIMKNDLTTACKHKLFVSGLLQSRIIGLGTKAKASGTDKPDDKPKPGDQDAKKAGKAATKRPTRTQEEGGNTFNIFTVDPKDSKPPREEVTVSVVNPIFAAQCLIASLCNPGSESLNVTIKGDHISPLLRSPERVVRFLGELISAQNYGGEPFEPSILDPEHKGERFTVLTVHRGRPLPGMAAVSIRDPEGATFYIPRRSHDSPKTDLSLETLAIVTDVLNAAVSKKNFPAVAAITVASP